MVSALIDSLSASDARLPGCAQLWTLNEVDFRDIPGLHLAGRTGR